MKLAKTEQDIIDNADSKGILDCALRGFRAGIPVLICNPDVDDPEQAADKIAKIMELLETNPKKPTSTQTKLI